MTSSLVPHHQAPLELNAGPQLKRKREAAESDDEEGEGGYGERSPARKSRMTEEDEILARLERDDLAAEVCVCACVRARARVCVCVCVYGWVWGSRERR